MILKTTCDDATKTAFVGLAEREGMSESALLRRIVGHVIASNPGAKRSRTQKPVENVSDRVHVRLTTTERKAAQRLADAEGRTLAQWVRALVRSATRTAVPFNASELEGLREVLAIVGPLARNLNVITRELHRTGRIDARSVKIGELKEAYADLSRDVTALMDRASSRYEAPDA